MKSEVAVYVQAISAKPPCAVESYNVLAWGGLEMVCQVLQQSETGVD